MKFSKWKVQCNFERASAKWHLNWVELYRYYWTVLVWPYNIYVLKLRLPCWEKLFQTEATAQNVSHFSNSHTNFLNSVRTKSRLFSTSTQHHSASSSLRRHRLPYNKALSGNYMGKITVLKYWFEVYRDDQFPQTGITTQPAGWCPGPRGNIFAQLCRIYLPI